MREQVWKKFVNRGDNGDANDTNATIVKELALRQQRAKLLGFKNHAYYRMDDTMAETPANAMNLMMRVWPAAVARVHEEVADMQKVADAEGAKLTIEPWDYRFYAEKVRKAKYDLDEAEVKPYLELGNILQGAFYAAGRLYDLGFKENTGTIPVFDPGGPHVRGDQPEDRRECRRLLLRRLCARRQAFGRVGDALSRAAGARRAPQRAGLEQQQLPEGRAGPADADQPRRCNDAVPRIRPRDPRLPAARLLSGGLAGTPRDFVEYPSQVNENWLLTRDVLDRYAKHYQTGQPMPAALVDKIEKSSTFNQGFSTRSNICRARSST